MTNLIQVSNPHPIATPEATGDAEGMTTPHPVVRNL
jgi:hypothetical protein